MVMGLSPLIHQKLYVMFEAVSDTEDRGLIWLLKGHHRMSTEHILQCPNYFVSLFGFHFFSFEKGIETGCIDVGRFMVQHLSLCNS